MMFKKLLSVVLCFVLLFALSACGGGDPTVEEVSNAVSDAPSAAPVPTSAINPLTGLDNLDLGKENLRPVAIMINNINVAQEVQAGVGNADIVYETEVEGGITRLLAVFKDASTIGNIGTIRSARYPYIDLALGHDAIYIHHGQDPTYAAPYLSSSGVADFRIDAPFAYRHKNGKAYEHTLYSSGEKILAGIEANKFRTTTDKTANFANFRKEADCTAPSYAAASKAEVKFSNYATSVFTYNEQTGLYTKTSKAINNKDYFTGEAYNFKNVFILSTNISAYPDGYHMRVALESGSGYYMSAGGYEPIRWVKGSGSASFKFYAQDGSELQVNAGNSYVCLHKQSSTISFE